jgi:hypothetical protein
MCAAADLQSLTDALGLERSQRRRAECAADIQRDAVQLALDLLVREPNVAGFFRAFMQSLMEKSASHACGVWLLDDPGLACDLWMANVQGVVYTKDQTDWPTLDLPREAMSSHLLGYRQGWSETTHYSATDPRLPERVQAFSRAHGISSIVISPMALPSRNLGWVALASADDDPCGTAWLKALVDAGLQAHWRCTTAGSGAERLEERRQAIPGTECTARHSRHACSGLRHPMQLQAPARGRHPLPSPASRQSNSPGRT